MARGEKTPVRAPRKRKAYRLSRSERHLWIGCAGPLAIGRGRSPRPEENALYPANPWPESIPDFAPAAQALYEALDHISLRLLEACAAFLQLAPGSFSSRVAGGWSTLRLIGYPLRLDSSLDSEGVPHADFTALTFFSGATDEGLQIKTPDGAWEPVSVEEGRIVVGVGDILHRWTNGVYRRLVHRVVVPSGHRRNRVSAPFFVVPRPEVSVGPMSELPTRTALPTSVEEKSVARYLADAIEVGGVDSEA